MDQNPLYPRSKSTAECALHSNFSIYKPSKPLQCSHVFPFSFILFFRSAAELGLSFEIEMTADKGKKAKVEEDGEPIDGELVIAIEKLQDVQEELEKINDEANNKLIEMEQKYNMIRRPSYNKRNEIIQSIPDFWLNAFLCHPALTDLFNEDDQKVFKYLKSLDVEDSKDVKSGYTITFIFSPNPYFKNDKLVKSYAFLDDGSCQITGTAINWKKGMDISGVADHEKKGKKRSANEESFFSWFSDSSEQGLDGVPDEVAEIIKDELWPNPLRYLNNEAEEAEEDDLEGNDDEEGTDDDNEDDDEEKEE